ncbi:MAG: MOSC domain-containing protein [Pseudomonadales bacterium]|nr:MOSC domain-containing protein [Pseudomonadales bacterium]
MKQIDQSRSQIEAITIYPIKGCRGQNLPSVAVTEMGLMGDREFTLIVAGQRANQKQVPLLYNLRAEWQSKDQLALGFPGKNEFMLDTGVRPGPTSQSFNLSIHTKFVETLDMGDEVANWLTAAMQVDVRLVRASKANKWFIPLPEFAPVHDKNQTKFVDAAPVLLTNQNSLLDLNQRIEQYADDQANGSTTITMDRFRANIVVSGLTAYQEDNISQFRFPRLSLKYVTVCERCIVTTTNQQTGVQGKEPLRTLSKIRKRKHHYAGGLMFGVYVIAEGQGIISLGDELSAYSG